jgi:hypothetical protein
MHGGQPVESVEKHRSRSTQTASPNTLLPSLLPRSGWVFSLPRASDAAALEDWA